jgi:membrane-associated protease RseP (regulator of RpoE activity)
VNDATLFEFRGLMGFNVAVRQSVLFLVLLCVLIGFRFGPMVVALDVSVLLLSIYLHEVGHAWACRVQGIAVREVAIYGGGGVTTPGRSLSRREDEFVTAMGPIVNLALWALSSLALPHVGFGLTFSVLATIGWFNLFLAIFNLLPMLPLDGGRLMRLILERLLPNRTAARLAGAIGLGTGVIWVAFLVFSFVFGLGLLLLFLPDFGRHWQMLKKGY